MKYIIRYKWILSIYIIYAAFIPVWLDEGLDLRPNDQFTKVKFWYGLIICYFAVPLIIYISYYIIKSKVFNNIFKNFINNNSSIDIVFPPKEKDPENSWSLIDFAKIHGKMKVHRTDGLLDLCVFTNDKGIETKVYIAKSIKDYSVEDIQREKDYLSIITLDSDAYCLCKKWDIVLL